MTAYDDKHASGVGASASTQSRHLQTVILMNTSEHANFNTLRILVPINANEDSRWGVRYALRRSRQGKDVEVILLNVGEPVVAWEVLRFRTQQEIVEFQSARAQAFIDDAAAPLAAAGIPHRGVFKQGEVVFSILDAAEELDCDEIVMPAPHTGLSSMFSRDLVAAAIKRRRDIPVVTVDCEGISGGRRREGQIDPDRVRSTPVG